ncbi:CLUMA_CG000100, isoform A [Clunio marinus]|uniref:CLUMA_CG000100, isoform A n=1 Tax=Clunio marinus TaxID=568069 RepID=A0A1J1HIQ5_9DIPT|nr:CLUMA_CG000100, isoform A [Clunio marinus]
MPNSFDRSRIKKVVYNDQLGYSIVYYYPVGDNMVAVPDDEDQCQPRRQILHEVFPNDKIFIDEVKAIARKLERQNAEKEIRDVCEKVHDLFKHVEESSLSRRDILSYRVREQIKGKSADQICNILVDDVLKHTKYIYQPKSFDDNIPHKMKLKILKAAIERPSSSTKNFTSEYENSKDETVERENLFKRIEETLNRNILAEIHRQKYERLMNKIQHDITVLKRRCTNRKF